MFTPDMWFDSGTILQHRCFEGSWEGFLVTGLVGLVSIWLPAARQGETHSWAIPDVSWALGAKTFCWGLVAKLRVANDKPQSDPEMITSSTLQTKLADRASVHPPFSSSLDYTGETDEIRLSSEFRQLVYWMLGLNSKASKCICDDYMWTRKKFLWNKTLLLALPLVKHIHFSALTLCNHSL